MNISFFFLRFVFVLARSHKLEYALIGLHILEGRRGGPASHKMVSSLAYFRSIPGPGLAILQHCCKSCFHHGNHRAGKNFYKYFEFFNFVPRHGSRLILFLPQPQFLLILSIAIVNLFIKQNFCISFLFTFLDMTAWLLLQLNWTELNWTPCSAYLSFALWPLSEERRVFVISLINLALFINCQQLPAAACQPFLAHPFHSLVLGSFFGQSTFTTA